MRGRVFLCVCGWVGDEVEGSVAVRGKGRGKESVYGEGERLTGAENFNK